MNDAPRLARWLRIAAPALVACVLLALWQIGVAWYRLPPYIVPSPLTVMRTLIDDRALLFASLTVTLGITLMALALALIIGVLAAIAFAQSRWIEASFYPYAVLLQVTPIVSIAPLIIIWVRDTTIALVLCAAVVALFPVIANTTLGLRSIDPGLRHLFRLHRATRWQTLTRLAIPGALPYFFGGLRIATGLALIGAVVAEFVAGTGGQGAGLAYQILMAGIQLNVPRLFAALLLIAAAGVVLFAAASWLARAALWRWHESEMDDARD
jgi:NitT/TauT family transport system permease protein